MKNTKIRIHCQNASFVTSMSQLSFCNASISLCYLNLYIFFFFRIFAQRDRTIRFAVNCRRCNGKLGHSMSIATSASNQTMRTNLENGYRHGENVNAADSRDDDNGTAYGIGQRCCFFSTLSSSVHFVWEKSSPPKTRMNVIMNHDLSCRGKASRNFFEPNSTPSLSRYSSTL